MTFRFDLMKLNIFIFSICFQLCISQLSLAITIIDCDLNARARSLVESNAIIDSIDLYHYECIDLDGKIYYRPNGTLHLFEIDPIACELKRLDRSIYHGSTFFSKFFYHNGSFYLFGGTGLFNSSLNLLRFDSDLVEWELVSIENLSQYGNAIFSHIAGDSIFFLFNSSDRLNAENDLLKAGIINLKERVFKELQIDFYTDEKIVDRRPGLVFSNERFALIQSQFSMSSNALIFDFKTLSFYNIERHYGGINNQYGFQNLKNGLFEFTSENRTISIDPFNIIDDSKLIARAKPQSGFRKLWYFILFGVILAVLIIRNRIRSRRFQEVENQDEFERIIKELMVKKDRTLTNQELIHIFQLSDKPLDSQRVAKNLLIEKINATGKLKVERVRFSEDKRIMNYLIKG